MKLPTRKRPERQELLMNAHSPSFNRYSCLRFFSLLGGVSLICLCFSQAYADIYRFVTIDGVETFTDAPRNKEARVIFKDRPAPSSKRHQSSKSRKVHDISLEEVVRKTVVATLNPNEPAHERFEPRLPAVGGTITSTVGMRSDPIDGVWRHHNGIDIAIPTGTPVMPVAAGVVVYCGARSGYGNTVIVEHNNGVVTLYAHNSSLLVSLGQSVTTDSTLALSGSTGRSTGPHLHFEAWQAGTNVTTAFLPGSDIRIPAGTLIASSQRTPRFRSEVLSDGSVLYTNIPASTP